MGVGLGMLANATHHVRKNDFGGSVMNSLIYRIPCPKTKINPQSARGAAAPLAFGHLALTSTASRTNRRSLIRPPGRYHSRGESPSHGEREERTFTPR